MAEPNPGRVCSCLMSWELWLQSEHLLQKYYMGFTTVCGMFCDEELQGSKFHQWDTLSHELRMCVVISVLIFTGIIKPVDNFQKSLVAFSCA